MNDKLLDYFIVGIVCAGIFSISRMCDTYVDILKQKARRLETENDILEAQHPEIFEDETTIAKIVEQK